MRVVDELPFGFGWIAPEPAWMQRTSHAVVVDGRVWILDPVADDAMLERARGLGEPAGVVQLLDRHNRDSAAVAERLGVPHLFVPDAAPEGAPFEVVPVLARKKWREVALWFPGLRVLVSADAVGTARHYLAPGERLAVSPLLRLTPPWPLLPFEPEHVLVGHGAGVHEGAAQALHDAVRLARRRSLTWLVTGGVRSMRR